MPRPVVPEAEQLLGVKRPLLSHGFVALVDYMGNDAAIVQAARVSYGKGTKSVRDDRGLIRYLMRHRHTTPFEMVEYKFLVRLPIYVARQWIRHRTACLAEGTQIYFDLPGGVKAKGNQLYPLTIEEIWRRFQPTVSQNPRKQRDPFYRKSRVEQMMLRQLNEETRTIGHTHVVGVTKNGTKPVFRMTLEDGKHIECTADHRFLFEDGWATLAEGTGLREVGGRAVWDGGDHCVHVNGSVILAPALYHGREWLEDEHVERGRFARDVPAETAGIPSPRVPWNRLTVPRLSRVADFEFLGPRMTYDLEVSGPSHNFIANGIVTHNSVNEYSARYSVIPDEYDLPPPEEVRHQSGRSRQGRGEALPDETVERFRSDLERISKDAYEAYSKALEAGVARETARLLLPVSFYTQWYWKTNLWNLFHFLSLRLDPHAQEEIRVYAAEMAKLARVVAPIAFEAFEEFQLEGIVLGRRERIALRELLNGKSPTDACRIADLPLAREDGRPMVSGEGVEFLEKLERIRRID